LNEPIGAEKTAEWDERGVGKFLVLARENPAETHGKTPGNPRLSKLAAEKLRRST